MLTIIEALHTKGVIMFKYILTITVLTVSLFATSVSANTSVDIDSTVMSSTSIIQDVVREIPEKSCHFHTVPVYPNGDDSATKEIVGYKEVEECEITYVSRLVPMVVGYSTTVAIALGDGFDDFIATFKTNREYTVGSIVPVTMTLSLN
jgi:hypothetical protein